MKINRFLLFAGEDYYPLAGWNTFVNSYNSLDDAMANIETIDKRNYVVSGKECEWFEIVDLMEGNPVKQGGHPYGGLRGDGKDWHDNFDEY